MKICLTYSYICSPLWILAKSMSTSMRQGVVFRTTLQFALIPRSLNFDIRSDVRIQPDKLRAHRELKANERDRVIENSQSSEHSVAYSVSVRHTEYIHRRRRRRWNRTKNNTHTYILFVQTKSASSQISLQCIEMVPIWCHEFSHSRSLPWSLSTDEYIKQYSISFKVVVCDTHVFRFVRLYIRSHSISPFLTVVRAFRSTLSVLVYTLWVVCSNVS